MLTSRRMFLTALAGVSVAGCQRERLTSQTKELSPDSSPHESNILQASASSREAFVVLLETSRGDVRVEVHPDWAPRGAKRFRELVECGFYDGCRFFRVIEGFMVQVGMNGDPAVTAQWDKKKLRDDPVIQSNKRGFVTFATSGVDSRTTQFFINTGNNSSLDSRGFSPFGKVIEGMDVVESLYSKHKESPDQDKIRRRGNAYLASEFPELDAIVRATIES